MAKTLGLVFLLISLASLLSLAFSSSSPAKGLDWWCNKTRYPDTCKYTLRHRHRNNKAFNPNVPMQMSEFRQIELDLALEHAAGAENRARWLGSQVRSARVRAAYLDCLTLFEDSVELLNKTLDPDSTIKPTTDDSLTWLTAALTSLETCRDSFSDLRVSDDQTILPLLTNNNVSRLVSNALSIVVAGEKTGSETLSSSEFPKWVSHDDQKLLQVVPSVSPDVVVAEDGSGNFMTIQAALDKAAERNSSARDRRFVIQVKRGVYDEILNITGKKHKNIMLLGEGMNLTTITGNRSVGEGHGPYSTFNSSTVAVSAEGFMAQGITFRNTAGPQRHQAVALRASADLSVFFQCGFEGYQDTLYVHRHRQFFKECYIYGTIDFIFGNSAAVLQNCMIFARRPMEGQRIVVTAQGRIWSNMTSGISIHNSRVLAADDLKPVQGFFETYLGRPWKEFSRTVFSQTQLDDFVHPAGWIPWNESNFYLDTLFYAEYKNTGPGSATGSRVKWSGFRVMTNASEVLPFMVADFLNGTSWLPATGVPFTAGL